MTADQIELVVKSLLELKDTTSREELDTRFLEFKTKNKLFISTLGQVCRRLVCCVARFNHIGASKSKRCRYRVIVHFQLVNVSRQFDIA